MIAVIRVSPVHESPYIYSVYKVLVIDGRSGESRYQSSRYISNPAAARNSGMAHRLPIIILYVVPKVFPRDQVRAGLLTHILGTQTPIGEQCFFVPSVNVPSPRGSLSRLV